MTANPLTWPTRLLGRLRGVLTPAEPLAWLTVSVGGLDAATTAEVARHVTLDLGRRVSSLQPRYEAQFTHVPLQGAGTPPGTLLEEVSQRLIGHWPTFGPEDGPLKGCTCGERLGWGDGYSKHLARVALGLWTPPPGSVLHRTDDHEKQDGDTPPDQPPGFRKVQAGQAVEFLGRRVILPLREYLPTGVQVLEHAEAGTLETLDDRDATVDTPAVFLRLAGHAARYAVLHTDTLLVGPA